MAENKKSFVFYTEWKETFDALSDEAAGKLIKHILNYVNDKNPTTEDTLINLCFIPIKQQLKRDLKKYENYIDKQIANGKKGGRPKTQKTQRLFSKPKKAEDVDVDVDDISTIYDKFVEEVIEGLHKQATDAMYMRLKIKPGSLTQLLKDFKGQLIIDQTLHPNTLELRKHFNNWLNKLDQNGKLAQYKKIKTL